MSEGELFIDVHPEDQGLDVLIKNNGDYTQILNYQLEAIEIDNQIETIDFIITPRHHPEQQKICFNYKNLQPMRGSENIRKSNK